VYARKQVNYRSIFSRRERVITVIEMRAGDIPLAPSVRNGLSIEEMQTEARFNDALGLHVLYRKEPPALFRAEPLYASLPRGTVRNADVNISTQHGPPSNASPEEVAAFMRDGPQVKNLKAPSTILKGVKPEVEAFMDDIGGVRKRSERERLGARPDERVALSDKDTGHELRFVSHIIPGVEGMETRRGITTAIYDPRVNRQLIENHGSRELAIGEQAEQWAEVTRPELGTVPGVLPGLLDAFNNAQRMAASQQATRGAGVAPTLEMMDPLAGASPSGRAAGQIASEMYSTTKLTQNAALRAAVLEYISAAAPEARAGNVAVGNGLSSVRDEVTLPGVRLVALERELAGESLVPLHNASLGTRAPLKRAHAQEADFDRTLGVGHERSTMTARQLALLREADGDIVPRTTLTNGVSSVRTREKHGGMQQPGRTRQVAVENYGQVLENKMDNRGRTGLTTTLSNHSALPSKTIQKRQQHEELIEIPDVMHITRPDQRVRAGESLSQKSMLTHSSASRKSETPAGFRALFSGLENGRLEGARMYSRGVPLF